MIEMINSDSWNEGNSFSFYPKELGIFLAFVSKHFSGIQA